MSSAALYQVIFSLEGEHLERASQARTIVLSPIDNKWDDFGRKLFYRFTSWTKSGQRIEGVTRLAFLETSSDIEEVIASAYERSAKLVYAEKLPQFYSMMPSMQAYRDIADLLGDEAVDFLLAINDLVAFRKRPKKKPAWLPAALRSKEFTHGLIRESEAFFAYHNAQTILGRRARESLRGISESLRLEFKLAGFKGPHSLDFDFKSQSEIGEIPKRINVVIGVNGVGKTQSLVALVNAALDNSENLRDGGGGRPIISRIIAFETPGDGRHVLPPESRADGATYYKRLSMGGRDEISVSEVVVRLLRSKDRIGRKHRWDIFISAINTMFDSRGLLITLAPSSEEGLDSVVAKEHVYFSDLMPGSEQRSLSMWSRIDSRSDIFVELEGTIVPLSSGQRSFLRLAASVSLHVENGSLLLFDEPETHLHPKLISALVGLIDSLLSSTGSAAIIATHSAYFVREVPRSCVTIISRGENSIPQCDRPRLRTFGADIGAISYFVFGDEINGKLLEKMARSLPQEAGKREGALRSLADELSPEAVMELQRMSLTS